MVTQIVVAAHIILKGAAVETVTAAAVAEVAAAAVADAAATKNNPAEEAALTSAAIMQKVS
jgi:hypothetical protein